MSDERSRRDEYEPIPWGGAKLLLGFAFFAGAVAAAVLGPGRVGAAAWRASAPVFAIGCFAGAIVISWGPLIVCEAMRGDRPLIGWLREYDRRNVVGYTEWFYLTAELSDASALASFLEAGRGIPKKVRSPNSPYSPAIGIPLGGWGRRRPRCVKEDSTAIWRILRLLPQGKLYLEDAFGGRQPLSIKDALLAAREMNFESIRLSLKGEADRQEVRATVALSELRSTKEQVRKLEALIEEAIRRIKDTSRFGGSKEGMRIRKELGREFLKLLPRDDPRRRTYAEYASEEPPRDHT